VVLDRLLRLSVEPLEVHDGPGEASGAEIEGHDVICPDAVQTIVRPEPQSTRSAETDGAFRYEDPHEVPCDRVVFADARHARVY
jgi:hypothetical protein